MKKIFFVLRAAAVLLLAASLMDSCGVYSFSGASIDPGAKTVNVHFIDNKAPYNNPTLSQKFTQALRDKISSQSGLTQENSDDVDYIFTGDITGYSVSNAAVTNIEQPTTSRLTITVSIDFKDRIDPKKNFTQTFSRSADFDASKSILDVQDNLVDQIDKELVDDIFNRAFVNW